MRSISEWDCSACRLIAVRGQITRPTAKITEISVKNLDSQHMLRVFIFIGSNFAEQKSNRNYGKVNYINTSIYDNPSSMAQGITGKVVDENNTPLDFVNVVQV